MHHRILVSAILLAAGTASAQTFHPAPIDAERGLDALDRSVARETLDRDLFSSPWATVVIGRVDVYERFPYLESRWFQVVSDPAWNRILFGELDGSLGAHDGRDDALGALNRPRGLAVDENGRIYVADSGNHRIVAYDTFTEYGGIRLEAAFAIDGLHRPWDVAYSDGGTPWAEGDDRLYVADTGANRVLAYALEDGAPRLEATIGELGDGPGRFGGPSAVTVGRHDGACTNVVYVADAHSRRIVRLVDEGSSLQWAGEVDHRANLVTSLDTDHWGAVYAASPAAGTVTKLTADLEPVASLESGLQRPRAFHVPFVTRTDHRTGTRERAGRGAGLIVEEWTGSSGIRLVKLGVEVRDLQVFAERALDLDFVLTDRADVTAEILDPESGRVERRVDLGTFDAGRGVASLDVSSPSAPLVDGDWLVRLSSRSTYDDAPAGGAEARFDWSGGVDTALPAIAGLVGSSPNPFRSSTSIEFAIPAGASRAWTLTVHDVTGRRVAELGSGRAEPGVHSVSWDGRDVSGRTVAAGIYLYRLDVEGDVSTRKAVHLR